MVFFLKREKRVKFVFIFIKQRVNQGLLFFFFSI